MPVLKRTTALDKISQLRKRIRVVQGGTNASKTFSVIAYLIHTAQANDGLLISVVSETMPHLKRGAMRDFLAIMQGQNYFEPDRWNRTDFIYSFESGSQLEFLSADQPGKVRGPRRDILFVNECNNVTWEIYDQLAIRTRKLVIVDFNPVAEFWLHEEILPKRDHDFLQLTYLDNEAISTEERAEIEAHRDNENWWKVYGLGELGVNEGQIYRTWEFIERIPAEAKLIRYGLDFGFTNDPTAIVAVYYHDNTYILDEVCYLKGLSNKEIATKLKALPKALVIADSAEPKSISEISRYGVRIRGAVKGPGSVSYGIQLLQDNKIHVTKRSTFIIKEYRNYLWKMDRDTGKPTNDPEDVWNHTMDAARYALGDVLKRRKVKAIPKPAGF